MNRRVRKRLQPTLGDYLAIAIGPLLIGLLVGSMVFFLIEVFYQGQFGGRLQFIMAWFVVGAVGIARISIEDGREHAALFAVPLAILVSLAAWRFVEFTGPLKAVSPLLSIGLVALIWWSTDCLTWDCTVIDEDDPEGDGGVGLLETAGLDAGGGVGEIAAEADATTEHETVRQSLWQRFVEYRRRPHAPGVWVLYFSLAALPLFGLGQLLLPADNDAVRRRVFLFLVVYVASGLGLLLVTSFLNLRRYLRQRRLIMPATMAATWVLSGTLVIAGILLVCLILAGRGVGYTAGDLPLVASIQEGLQTSRWAAGGAGQEAEEGTQERRRDDAERVRAGDAERAEDGPAEEAGEQRGAGESSQSDPQEERTSAERPSPSPEPQGRPTATQAQQTPAEAGQGREGAGEQDVDAENAGGEQPSDEGQAAGEGQEAQQDGPPPDAEGQRGQPAAEQPPPPPMLQPPSTAGWLKVVGWLLLAVIVVGAVWWYRHAILAALQSLAEAVRALWERLFGGATRGDQRVGEAAEAAVARRRTFAEFSDPFRSGAAEGAATDELIRYSYEAFEAWAGDLGFHRRPQQTAHEFAEDVVGERLPAIAREARQLAELVSWSTFSAEAVPRRHTEHLRRLWQKMQQGRRGFDPPPVEQ